MPSLCLVADCHVVLGFVCIYKIISKICIQSKKVALRIPKKLLQSQGIRHRVLLEGLSIHNISPRTQAHGKGVLLFVQLLDSLD